MIILAIRLPPSAVSPAAVRGLAGQILRQGQFRQAPESLLTRVELWALHLLGVVIRAIISAGDGSLVGLGVTSLILAGAAVVVVRFARRLPPDPVIGSASSLGSARSVAAWTADAERFEQAGQWRAALRCRYRALVGELHARGVVDEVPGRTTAEYLALVVRNLPQAAGEFARASDLFETAWYGDRYSGPAEGHRFGELTHQILTVAPTGRPSAHRMPPGREQRFPERSS